MNHHARASARSGQGGQGSYPIIDLAFRAGRVAGRLLTVGLVLALALVMLNPTLSRTASAAPACPNGRTMNIVAFEDDDLLFLNTDILHDIEGGVCVRTVFVSAGDAGRTQSYWHGREAGSKAAYAEMAGVSDAWTSADAGIADHPMPVLTLTNDPTVSLVFMRLPDGGGDGSGFTSTGNESLQKLWQGDISQIDAVDGSSSYTKQQLIDTLAALMTSFGPDTVRTQDFLGSYGDGDHSDHHSTAYFVKAASPHDAGPHQLVGYLDNTITHQPPNLSQANQTAKQNAFFAYAPHDHDVCQGLSACQAHQPQVYSWFSREYSYPPPKPAITSHPASLTNSKTATFAFSDTESRVSFTCALDAGSFSACTSPKHLSGLSAGTHTFHVRAVDGATSTFSQRAWKWKVDLTPPQTTITSGPTGTVKTHKATFRFHSSEQGSKFLCSLDGAKFKACSSPKTVTVAKGSHTLRAKAVDRAGNADRTPAVRKWKVV